MVSKIVTTKGLFKTLWQSTLGALALILVIHSIKVYLETPSQEPSMEECDTITTDEKRNGIDGFWKFYRFYLCEHSHKYTKLFHFVGTFNALVFLSMFLDSGMSPKLFVFGFVQGYAFAWFSHFFIEQNKPATFRYPVSSFCSDFVLFKDLATGSLSML